ncbi:fumarylacetoacetate hydrolase family protein [Simiduia curdlanivorans]|uniref:Fumarylacetoacetate hydrolase family protein n=1 Tax=Simiduia curdlanivorans TaxID=1492769 RepID=A0ABV8V331_9GAMM|nr:fumarylacetoacetate hydrolase family protein [Simiduia curdlanivorans]MDN3637717.1 fumarylacetoacetate hydrolase family protein [Simiduia curdlanivorans]
MTYQHRWAQPNSAGATAIPLPLGKIVCVGQNYADHIKEMGSKVGTEPMLFIKTAGCARDMAKPFSVPRRWGSCHFETEMSVLIGTELKDATPEQALASVAGIGLAFDLTLRELQAALKQKGHPWEKAKGFDGSAPLSAFLAPPEDLQNIGLRLTRNGVVTQDGNTRDMLTPVAELLAYASQFFSFAPGDVLLTGTPAGVGPLEAGDELVAQLLDSRGQSLLRVATQVI